MNAYIEKNEVRICEKVSNNLGQLSSTLPKLIFIIIIAPTILYIKYHS